MHSPRCPGAVPPSPRRRSTRLLRFAAASWRSRSFWSFTSLSLVLRATAPRIPLGPLSAIFDARASSEEDAFWADLSESGDTVFEPVFGRLLGALRLKRVSAAGPLQLRMPNGTLQKGRSRTHRCHSGSFFSGAMCRHCSERRPSYSPRLPAAAARPHRRSRDCSAWLCVCAIGPRHSVASLCLCSFAMRDRVLAAGAWWRRRTGCGAVDRASSVD